MTKNSARIFNTSSSEYIAMTDKKSLVDNMSVYPAEVTVTTTDNEIRTTIQQSLIDPDAETHVYKRRWYILLAYSLLACTQGGYWNTWGPIAESSEDAFGWSDADIALLSNWGPISYVLSTFVMSWVVDVKGLRWACLSTAIMVAAGAGARCITDQPPYVKWTVNIGQFLNGLAGPVAMGVPPALSALWFPVKERTTATAIATILNGIGVGISFALGPYMVPDRISNQNITASNYSSANTTERISHERHDIMIYMYVEAAWAVFVLLLILVYFPAKPPKPPTLSASVERMDFMTGAKTLIRNARFWVICATYGISLGVFNCWQSVLDVILKPHKIDESEAGWLGFYSILAGCVGSVILARFADVFSRHMKMFLLLLYISGTGCFVWFTLLINGTIPESTYSLYAAIILATLLLNASVPLYFEMACEATYPVAEGITNFVLTLVNNIGGLVFLLINMIPNIGTAWENWTCLGAIASCIPVLFFIKENYNRLEVDEIKKV
ncbi:solute carrier family 49 member 4 homolog isoform X1 [Crassostrea angulata]|uniref:solute carrier family 49 member 4 homolog isoform X1 n=1 Tax=Magallana angulata TaxID=2784310 RepID=UPI0022B0EDE5|nr:solute carrier family 49 member 4 homolog isoform X1 [Crassostrea angulata]